MLIATLNRLVFLLILLVTLPRFAAAHGDGGLDAQETAMLYASMMQAMEEAGAATEVIMSDLERRYALEGKLPTDAATVEFLNERITLDTPAFSKLIDRSIDVFRARLERECPDCYFEKRIIRSVGFSAKVFGFFKNYFLHWGKILHTGATNPRSLGPAAIGLTASGLRLFAIHGPVYLVYTAATEAIESAVMGPAHWACTFFQAIYFPLAVVGHHLWDPIVSSGHGFSMLQRLRVSKRSIYMLAVYKWQMRKLFVESALGTHRTILSRGDYKNYVAGIDHHIEAEMNYGKFWGEIYRNFHAQSQTHQPNYHGTGMALTSDFAKIFAPASLTSSANQPESYSEAERFYTAVKHADGLNLTLSLLVSMTDEMYHSGKYNSGTYLRVAWLLGQAGAHIKRYQSLLVTGALSPRHDAGLQRHQSKLAQDALQSVQKFFKSAQLLTKTDRMDQDTIRWVTKELATDLKVESKRLKAGTRTRQRFGAQPMNRCRAFLAMASFGTIK